MTSPKMPLHSANECLSVVDDVASTTRCGPMRRDPSGIAFKAVLSGTMHFDFTDLAVVAPLTTTMLGWIGVGGREVHDIIGAASLRFLRGFNHPRWDPSHSLNSHTVIEKFRSISANGLTLTWSPDQAACRAKRYGHKPPDRLSTNMVT